MNAQLTEIMRLITNLIRTGVVTEVDRENWLCRVKTGELETNWISWLTLRAGNARTWWRPSEGEQVVLLSLGGNLETAFALPAVYSNQFAPPSTSAEACVTEHPDGGWFEYEPATGRWYVRGIKSMVIEAADNITLKTCEFVLEADHTRINSEVVINGGVITITRKDGDSHRFTLADRGAYTGVIASWLHTREPAKNESTTVKRKRRTKKQKKEPEAKQGDYLVGTDENVLVLNRTYANRSNAERAAKMQWERLQRGVASFSLQLAEGRADLYTEMPVKVSGFKQPIDDAEWTITTLTHTVSHDNGFTTSLELEVRIDDFEME
ncbi:TPA: phage baseplate assembly protein V [Escherichia coli]